MPSESDHNFDEPAHNRMADEVIRQAVYHYGLPPGHTWEDIRQQVLDKFASWLKTGRKAGDPVKLLWTITKNLLIDLSRKQGAECRDIKKEVCIDDPERDESQKLAAPEDDICGRILIEELRKTLSGADRDLFDQHFIIGRTLKEIAQKRGVTKQAVSGQWGRILNKLKPLV